MATQGVDDGCQKAEPPNLKEKLNQSERFGFVIKRGMLLRQAPSQHAVSLLDGFHRRIAVRRQVMPKGASPAYHNPRIAAQSKVDDEARLHFANGK